MLETTGGLGLFLLGMIIMTDGLRSLAGHTIRNVLIRFTHTPLTGAITGATTTAILQSSSATTVAAIGFVGAGLITFSSALGIIFGANIGTTITGWIVVLLGFKFKLGTLMLPVILIGVLLRLFGNERLSRIGYTLAGFGLIFIGITYMQQGMSGFQSSFLPAAFSVDTLQSKMQLLVIGIMFTVITQSSSAGVAVAITALHADTIHFQQAAILVVGMDIGTTVTAAIATIGGSIESRRTGFSHVIYNLITGTGAFLFIPVYIYLWTLISADALSLHSETALVAFHTLFNILGVIIVLPFTKNFALFMQRIIPENGPVYTQSLDQSLLNEPAVAITATRTTVHLIFIDLLRYINRLLGGNFSAKSLNLDKIHRALDETQSYIDNIHLGEEKTTERETLIAIIHSLDHLQRLARRCKETNRTRTINMYPDLANDRRTMVASNSAIIQQIENDNWQEVIHHATTCNRQIESQVQPVRKNIMENIIIDKIDVPLANEYLDALRWLDRVSDHIERITHHLANDKINGAGNK